MHPLRRLLPRLSDDRTGGIGEADPGETAAAIVDLITGGAGNEAAIRWTEACSGSGYCIPACKHGINPRFMVQLARGFARRNAGTAPLPTRWRQGFQTMSRGVRVLSRLQMPPETLARFAPSKCSALVCFAKRAPTSFRMITTGEAGWIPACAGI